MIQELNPVLKVEQEDSRTSPVVGPAIPLVSRQLLGFSDISSAF
jgi:hypothetical protein